MFSSAWFVLLDQDYEKAAELYTEAIDLNPNVPAYYANRSFANLKLENFGYALADATKALELDRSYIKVSGIQRALISVEKRFLFLQ